MGPPADKVSLMTSRTRAAVGCSVATLFVVLLGSLEAQQVSFDRIFRAEREPQNWLSYSGTVFNQRHSLLTQIAPGNVKNLELQ